MKIKSIAFITLLAAAIISTIFTRAIISRKNTVTILSDYKNFSSYEELVQHADTIIKGKIIDVDYENININQVPDNTSNEFLNPGGDITQAVTPYTVFTVEITKTYKGNYNKKQNIKVKQLGGILNGIKYEEKDVKQLKIKGNYILFLETYTDDIPASLLNPIQGSYTDNNGIIVPNEGNNIQFKISDLEK